MGLCFAQGGSYVNISFVNENDVTRFALSSFPFSRSPVLCKHGRVALRVICGVVLNAKNCKVAVMAAMLREDAGLV